MPTAPPYTQQAGDHELMGRHGPPPPKYDHRMGQGQPAGAPYPQQNMGMGMPPMQQGPPPQQPYAAHPSSTTVVVTGAVTGGVPMGPKPVMMRCPNCNMDIQSKTETEYKGNAHIACLLLFIFGCGLCSCIPYCIDTYKNVTHTCPNCNAFLGMYSP